MFYLALEQLVEASELEQAGALPEEVGSLDGVDPIKHGVVVDGYFFVDEAEEVVRDVGLAERVIVDDGVLLAEVVPA